MNDRERFIATMHYQERDRCPICDFGFWDETIDAWHEQGFPPIVEGEGRGEQASEFFGMDRWAGGPTIEVGLCPGFESCIIEDRGDHEVVQQGDGVRVLRAKRMSSIPHHESHLLVGRESWEEHYKPRLDPTNPDRYPDWQQVRDVWDDPDYDAPRTVKGGSLYGWIRNWMGMENVSYLAYDNPDLFGEMVETIADCVVGCHRIAFEHGAKFDACSMWEDMCYNAGPLLPPDLFKQFLVPQYKRITGQLRAGGCDVVYLDSDGDIRELIPMWLEAGVNCMFPLEIGTWGIDPVELREQYGKDLLMMGGFDKHILARTKQEIEAEVHRLAPVVDESGFIPFCDHRVPPDVPLENYVFYVETVRSVWGKDVNLKPIVPLQLRTSV
ncbi:MAG: uroporphyrinogen decarboxylase family protein [Phycisphaeraceae bacterium]|jgi:uroporphyrinogen decarboxylase|nr:uroporphyrinogen decarboxylase family protein [Phycisphaeraceae bacterium]